MLPQHSRGRLLIADLVLHAAEIPKDQQGVHLEIQQKCECRNSLCGLRGNLVVLVWCSVAFAEAALLAFSALKAGDTVSEMREDWAELCSQSLLMLRSLSSSHPNRRKVYAAVVSRLLVPILACTFGTGNLRLHRSKHVNLCTGLCPCP